MAEFTIPVTTLLQTYYTTPEYVLENLVSRIIPTLFPELGKPLGCGYFGCVFRHPHNPERAIKLTVDAVETLVARILMDDPAENVVRFYKISVVIDPVYQYPISVLERDLADYVLDNAKTHAERKTSRLLVETMKEASEAMAEYDAEYAHGVFRFEDLLAARAETQPPQVKNIVQDIITAIASLRERGIIFTDFHPGNVGKLKDRYVIVDLGFSRVFPVEALVPEWEKQSYRELPVYA